MRILLSSNVKMWNNSHSLYRFQDKLYILSSAEAHHKFVTNPRPYLLPPMPRLPCKVSIIGPSLAGKTTLCKLLAQHYNTAVIDMEELLQPVLVKAKEERINKIKEETTQAAIDKIKMKMKEDGQNSGKLNFVGIFFSIIICRITFDKLWLTIICFCNNSNAMYHGIITCLSTIYY